MSRIERLIYEEEQDGKIERRISLEEGDLGTAQVFTESARGIMLAMGYHPDTVDEFIPNPNDELYCKCGCEHCCKEEEIE